MVLKNMLRSFISNLLHITIGYDWGRVEDENTDESFQPPNAPMVKTGMSNRKIKSDIVTRDTWDECETIKSEGTVTAIDLERSIGVIERKYSFDAKRLCSNINDFIKGSRVAFDAKRDCTSVNWEVTSMRLLPAHQMTINEKCLPGSILTAQVKHIKHDKLTLYFMSHNETGIVCKNNIPHDDTKWIEGDVIEMKLDAECVNGIPLQSVINKSLILSFHAKKQKTIVGKLKKVGEIHTISDIAFSNDKINTKEFQIGNFVACTAISAEKVIENVKYTWRAVDIGRSSFLRYNSPEIFSRNRENESWDTSITAYEDILLDKFGVTIQPLRKLHFGSVNLRTSVLKKLSIRNGSCKTLYCSYKLLNNYKSASNFKIDLGPDKTDFPFALSPDEEIDVNVTCTPFCIGINSEICVFEFGNFSIGRELTVNVVHNNELSLFGPINLDNKMRRNRQSCDLNLSTLITDRGRVRIRGYQNVRPSFFEVHRPPLNKVPADIYEILKNRDEHKLSKQYPGVLLPLEFSNYVAKFQIGLWFEEIEMDIRRRNFDVKHVILSKTNAEITSYTFLCDFVNDIYPPVHVNDMVDALDESNDTNAKYQGTVTNIDNSQITCVFGKAFDANFKETPVTIQFNLGRTAFKRRHYAIEMAAKNFGRTFLFPQEGEALKTPYIIVILKIDENGGHKDHNDAKEVTQRVWSCSSKAQANASLINSINCKSFFGKRALSNQRRVDSSKSTSVGPIHASLTWVNGTLNDQQKEAVVRILRAEGRPSPYVLFGPAGTGKTVTLVEAIIQVYTLDINSRILVCTSSNISADIIAMHLVKSNVFQPKEFCRFNGFQRSESKLCESLIPYCTNGENLQLIAATRLIVCTCITAGQFQKILDANGMFSHVFVDESCQVTEPELLIPCTLLLKNSDAQVVLSGDQTQLGATLVSEFSHNCGLGLSFLERLLRMQPYSRNKVKFASTTYDPVYATKLTVNYRSHPFLVKLASSIFHEDESVSCYATSNDDQYLLGNPKISSILVSEGVPFVFHGIKGKCMRGSDSSSWCNIEEAIQIDSYVHCLLGQAQIPSYSIGIITPYRKQVEQIQAVLRRRLSSKDLPKIGTVEQFQAIEKQIIIISTVRSADADYTKLLNVDRFGFIYKPKRLNVAITRAKQLLIVIGNPYVLAEGAYWQKLLRYAIDTNAYTGCDLPPMFNKKIMNVLEEKMRDTDADQDAFFDCNDNDWI